MIIKNILICLLNFRMDQNVMKYVQKIVIVKEIENAIKYATMGNANVNNVTTTMNANRAIAKLNYIQGNVRAKEMGIYIVRIANAKEMKFVLKKDA